MRKAAAARAWRAATCVGLAGIALGAAATAAPAATLSVEQRVEYVMAHWVRWTDLRYQATPGEANDLLVLRAASRDATWLDAGAPIFVAPADQLATQRPTPSPFGSPDTAGCAHAHGNGTLVGGRRALGAATCLFVDGLDYCRLGINPWCQGAAIAGFARTVIRTGDGADTVRALNGREDRIDCGTEQDTAYVDRLDTVAGCEVVVRS